MVRTKVAPNKETSCTKGSVNKARRLYIGTIDQVVTVS